MKIRAVKRNEIEEIRIIDRSEIINQIYYYKNSKLILKNEYYNVTGWEPNNIERNINNLYELYERGGSFFGIFQEEKIGSVFRQKIVGIVALECIFIGSNNDQLQVVFLHIDNNYRKKGYGKILMNQAKVRAKELGAKKLYISATPSKNTVDFYMYIGCKLASEINADLYQLEPNDIHLEMII